MNQIKIRSIIPDFLRTKKNLPESITNLDKIAFMKIADIEPTSNKPIFNNQAKLEELNKIFNTATIFLDASEHDQVWEAFTLFFEQDLDLKEQIAKALMPQSDEEFISEETLTNLIELQGFSSNFRIRLLEAIAGKLIDLFDKSNMFFQTGDIEKGAIITNQAQNLYNFYTVRLKKYEAPLDDYRGAMYFECKTSLDIVKSSGDRNLAEMTHSVINRENEVKKS